MSFWLQTEKNQIFEMKWSRFLHLEAVKVSILLGQSWRSKKSLSVQPARARLCRIRPSWQFSVRPPTLTSCIFAASWPTKGYSNLFPMIWFISIFENHKSKIVICVLMCVMLTQSTPISYHTKGLVITEVIITAAHLWFTQCNSDFEMRFFKPGNTVPSC